MVCGFVLEAEDVVSMRKRLGDLSELELLANLVHSAKSMARPLISSYHVAAAGLGSTGRIFLGVNLEFPGLPLSQSVHAEQFLITNAALHGEPSLTHIAVSSAPCGHCRQFFQEIRSAPDIRILINPIDSDYSDLNSFRPISQFLPDRFSPCDLLDPAVPLFFEPRDNRLILAPAVDATEKIRSVDGEIVQSALTAANLSHAPYSRCPSGVALRGSNGRLFVGSYTESAAYNPSLPPIQAALVSFVAGGNGGYDEIKRAVLVERKGAPVVQEGIVRLVLAAIAPECEFSVVHCQTQPINLDGPALNHI